MFFIICILSHVTCKLSTNSNRSFIEFIFASHSLKYYLFLNSEFFTEAQLPWSVASVEMFLKTKIIVTEKGRKSRSFYSDPCKEEDIFELSYFSNNKTTAIVHIFY